MEGKYLFSKGHGELDVDPEHSITIPDELMCIVQAVWEADKDNKGKVFLEKGEVVIPSSDGMGTSKYYNCYTSKSHFYETQRRFSEFGVDGERTFRVEPFTVKEGNLPLPGSLGDLDRVFWHVKDNRNYFIISDKCLL